MLVDCHTYLTFPNFFMMNHAKRSFLGIYHLNFRRKEIMNRELTIFPISNWKVEIILLRSWFPLQTWITELEGFRVGLNSKSGGLFFYRIRILHIVNQIKWKSIVHIHRNLSDLNVESSKKNHSSLFIFLKRELMYLLFMFVTLENQKFPRPNTPLIVNKDELSRKCLTVCAISLQAVR